MNQSFNQTIRHFGSDGTIVSVTNDIVRVEFPDGTVTEQPIHLNGLGNAATTGATMTTIGGTIMKIGAVIEPPADAIVVAVGAIIAAIGSLVTLFSNSAKTRRLNAEAAAYEAADAELQDQNNQLDAKIALLKQNIDKMKQALGITIPGYGSASVVNGLGFCLINCAQNEAQARLDKAKTLYNSLVSQQAEKVQTLHDMSVFSLNLIQKQNYRTAIFVGLGLAFVFVASLIIQRKFFN